MVFCRYSTNKTDRHDILLKVALSIITITLINPTKL